MTRLRSDSLRLNDEVEFSIGADKLAVGRVEKINRKTVKVRQTNDASTRSNAAFGRPGGRRRGGIGTLWTISVANDGTCGVDFTASHRAKVDETARGSNINRQQRLELISRHRQIVVELRRLGEDPRELLDIIDGRDEG